MPGVIGVAVIAVYSYFFLHAESQVAVLGLVAIAGIGVPILGRFGWIAETSRSLEGNKVAGRIAIAVALAAIVWLFREENFAMLMLATVLFYTVACLGLTVQFGYAGVVNFAGAAFLGVGGDTSAMLGAHLPHVFVFIIGGGLPPPLGPVAVLPLLRP